MLNGGLIKVSHHDSNDPTQLSHPQRQMRIGRRRSLRRSAEGNKWICSIARDADRRGEISRVRSVVKR